MRRAARRRACLLFCVVVLTALGAPLTALGAPGAPEVTAVTGPAVVDPAFSVDTNLLSASFLSAWQIDRFLAAHTSLPALGSAFKAAETRYGVNARYLLALAMHESGFGRSVIAQRYHNLFGWHANDRNPLANAGRFATFAAGIDVVASQIAAEYLRPGGRYYGGAPTLRGMHGYASDPNWAAAIAAVANAMAIPSLGSVAVAFSSPVTAGIAEAGRPLTVTADAAPGDPLVPDGLRLAARFVPLAVVEARPAPAVMPDADPAFTLVDGSTAGGRLTARVTAPAISGRYELELQVRDSDGTALGDASRIVVPPLVTRVYGRDAVAYSVHHSTVGLSLAVTNVGRTTIPAQGGSPAQPTVLTVWLLPDGGPATHLTDLPLGIDLPPGATWVGQLPVSALEGMLPGFVILRVVVGDHPGRLSGSPPEVVRVSAMPGAADVAAGPVSSPSPDGGAPAASVPPAAAVTEPLDLVLHTIAPEDPATAALASHAPPPTDTPHDAVALSAGIDSATGAAIVTITNNGSTTIHTVAPAPSSGGPGPISVSAPAITTLVISAVPAAGAAAGAVELEIPLAADLAPGEAVTLSVPMPPVSAGPVAYLVAARLVPAVGTEASPAGIVFWMAGPAPTLTPGSPLGLPQ